MFAVDESVHIDHNTFLNRYATYSAINGGISTQLATAPQSPRFGTRRPSLKGRNSSNFYADSQIDRGSQNGGERHHGHEHDNDVQQQHPGQHTPLLHEDHTTVHFKLETPEAFLPLPLV